MHTTHDILGIEKSDHKFGTVPNTTTKQYIQISNVHGIGYNTPRHASTI